MNLTTKQWFQIISGSISGFITAGALFTSLFGETTTLKIIAGLGLANIILSSVGTVLSGQGAAVKEVLAMPGVEKITVNAQANQTLSAIAVDPKVDNIAPTVAAEAKVAETAKGVA